MIVARLTFAVRAGSGFEGDGAGRHRVGQVKPVLGLVSEERFGLLHVFKRICLSTAFDSA